MEHAGKDETIRLIEGAIRRHEKAVTSLRTAAGAVLAGGAPAIVEADLALAAALHHGQEARARTREARAQLEPT